MKCKCGASLVFKNPNYCKEHFIEYFEDKVEHTINKFNMLSKKDKIAVGVSGGKDSLTLLYLLNKFGYDVYALAIDEGINKYRDPNFKHVKEFCKKYNVQLKTFSFKESFGKTLDEMNIKEVGGMPCTTCGTLRRYLLNKHSQGFNKIATGHNLDDESQSVMMNLLKNNLKIMPRQGPITKDIKGFTQKIKPLYLMKEKEVAAYAFLQKFIDKFVECPNAHLAYRIYLRDLLNEYESLNPGTKENIIKKSLEIVPKLRRETKFSINKCIECGYPASKETCKACQIKVKI